MAEQFFVLCISTLTAFITLPRRVTRVSNVTQPAIIYPKLAIERLEQSVKYAQS